MLQRIQEMQALRRAIRVPAQVKAVLRRLQAEDAQMRQPLAFPYLNGEKPPEDDKWQD